MAPFSRMFNLGCNLCRPGFSKIWGFAVTRQECADSKRALKERAESCLVGDYEWLHKGFIWFSRAFACYLLLASSSSSSSSLSCHHHHHHHHLLQFTLHSSYVATSRFAIALALVGLSFHDLVLDFLGLLLLLSSQTVLLPPMRHLTSTSHAVTRGIAPRVCTSGHGHTQSPFSQDVRVSLR